MLSLKDILRVEQKNYIKYAMKNISHYLISEMPTAFGKTITTLALASELIKKKDKKVILVTSNNLLAKEIYNESLLYKETHNISSLVIGKDNYLDINKIREFSTFYDLNRALEFCNKKFSEDGYVLIDDFINNMEINDENVISFLKNQLKNDNERYINIGDSEISITNYAYLLSLFLFAKKDKDENGLLESKLNFNPNEYYFIFDEVQELISMAEILSASSFSPYKLYLYTQVLINSIKNNSSLTKLKSLVKELEEYKSKVKATYQILANEDRIGEYELHNKDFINKKVEAIKKTIIKTELSTTIQKRLNKHLKDNTLFPAKLFLKELQEGVIISNSSDVILYYSKSKGFINFHTFTKDIKFAMALNFWKYVDSFIGVTATAIISENQIGNKALYSYSRLGINFNDIKSKDKELLVKGKLNKCLPIHSFKGVLSPQQARYFISDEDYIEDDDKRAVWIANKVINNFDNKNSIILVGGYDEVDKIYEALKDIAPKKVPLIKAQRDKNSISIIDKFKKKGGIAILTRNFTTGVNLKGKYLEKLFIVKLPYPVYTNRKWLELKEKNPKMYWYEYINEMLIVFRQAIGRLIRDEKDKGDIYILDGKLKKCPENLDNKIKFFLEKMSVKAKEKMK